jgi:hypothetical protein
MVVQSCRKPFAVAGYAAQTPIIVIKQVFSSATNPWFNDSSDAD